MHLQTVDEDSVRGPRKAKVWLETKGTRAFIPCLNGDLKPRDWEKLRRKVEGERGRLESRWIKLMVEKGWLRVDRGGPIVTLRAYPGTAHHYERTIDLREAFSESYWENIVDSDAVLHVGFDKDCVFLRVGTESNPDDRNYFPLVELVFED